MSDIANLLIGFSNGLKPETTADINNQTIQGQQIHQNDINLQYQAEQKKAQIAALAKRAEVLNNLHNANDVNRAQAVMDVAAYAPDVIKGVQDSYTNMSNEAQEQHLNDSATMLGYTSANKWDDAIAHQKSIIDTDKQAKLPTDADEQYLNTLIAAKNGDEGSVNAAKSLAQLHTSAVLGKDKFAEAYPNLAKLPTDIASTQATTKKTDAETNIAIPAKATADKAAAVKDIADANRNYDPTGAIDPDTGKPYVVNKMTGDFANSNPTGVSASLADAVDRLQPTEADSATATNPRSTATGAHQFVEDTWIDQIAKNAPNLVNGMSAKQIAANPKVKAQVLALRTNPKLSREMAISLAADNSAYLQDKGQEVNSATIAMSHKMGASNTVKMLKAPENTPMKAILSAQEARANPKEAAMTTGQYINSIVKQVGVTPINPDPDPSLTGEEALKQLPLNRRTRIQAYIDGKASITSRFGGIDNSNPDIALALRIDPSLAKSPNRYEAMKSLTDHASPAYNTITAVNTVMPHLADLVKIKHDKGDNSSYLGNAIGSISSATFRDIPGIGNRSNLNAAYNTANRTYSVERAKLLQGKAPGEKEIGDSLGEIGMDQPWDETKAAASESLKTMIARINAVKEQTEGNAGRPLPIDLFIKPDVQQKIFETQRLLGQRRSPNRNEVAHLLTHPDTAKHFDDTFGDYSSEYYLRNH